MNEIPNEKQITAAQGEYIRSPQIEARIQAAALCPFCGARPGVVPDVRFVCIQRGIHGIPSYYVRCWMCGAHGPTDSSPLGAIDDWSKQTTRHWTPLSDQSFMLADPQPFSMVMVMDDGRTVRFVEWEGEEIHAQFEAKLGHFRLCIKK